MLVLRRRPRQEIRIGEDIIVRVTEIRDGVVSLAIEAPPHVSVHRHEVWARIQAERNGPADRK